jgi:Fur family ferric uptake transcriptional regulator
LESTIAPSLEEGPGRRKAAASQRCPPGGDRVACREVKQPRKDEREALRELIRAAGLRVTAARVSVLGALREAQAALSHAEVAQRVEQAGLDRTTVYRNLIDLAQAGVLRRTDVDHTWRFELVEHGQERHPHFVCTDCGRVACLPVSSVTLRPGRGTPGALRRGNLEIELRGRCDACG